MTIGLAGDRLRRRPSFLSLSELKTSPVTEWGSTVCVKVEPDPVSPTGRRPRGDARRGRPTCWWPRLRPGDGVDLDLGAEAAVDEATLDLAAAVEARLTT